MCSGRWRCISISMPLSWTDLVEIWSVLYSGSKAGTCMRPSSGMTGLVLISLMIVVAGMNSVTDMMSGAGDRHTADCEYCAINERPVWVPPAGLSLPALLLDLTPESLMLLLTPSLYSDSEASSAQAS